MFYGALPRGLSIISRTGPVADDGMEGYIVAQLELPSGDLCTSAATLLLRAVDGLAMSLGTSGLQMDVLNIHG